MRKYSEMENMAANDETLGQEDTAPTSSPHTSAGNVQEAEREGNPRPIHRVSSFYTPYLEDRLCRKLKFFFMGPCEKIKAKRKCPWKLCIQILKIIIVTIQLIQFGFARSSFVEFTERSTTALKHLYLKDWNNGYETMPYPPAAGTYAVYEKKDLVDYVNYTWTQFENTEKIAIGSLHIAKRNSTHIPLEVCLQQYKAGVYYPNDTYEIDSRVVEECTVLAPRSDCDYCTDLIGCLKCDNMTLATDRLLVLTLKFSLRSFRLDMKDRNFPPQCYRINNEISFDDKNKDGQMSVSLKADFLELQCSGRFSSQDNEKKMAYGVIVLDVFVIIVASISCVLCIRSLLRGDVLRRETSKFFRHRFGKDLSVSDHLEFLNLWYVTIVINDIMTIIGSALKIRIETRNIKSSSSNYDLCGVMLGTGSLLAWMGVLRYIGFFQQFNILILTLKRAFPNMLRFLTCCFMLYIGFVICGWVVLGPYHIKFKHLSTSSECLYSLINGDDMFVTFSATVTDNEMVWYYSRFYLYIFISLFIYAVLNLFIAVIMDTYETIKDYYANGFPKSDLFEFIDKCTDSHQSPRFRAEDSSCNPVSLLCCCCNRQNPDEPNEYTRLISTA